MQTFLTGWENLGLGVVSNAVPITTGDAGQHAWETMSNAFDDPNCKEDLATISKELTQYPDETLHAKKNRDYPIALVNVGKMRRTEEFLKEWEDTRPVAIGLPKGSHCPASLTKATESLAPVITDANKESRIYSITQDLQVMTLEKLLTVVDGYYLVALKKAGAEGLIQ